MDGASANIHIYMMSEAVAAGGTTHQATMHTWKLQCGPHRVHALQLNSAISSHVHIYAAQLGHACMACIFGVRQEAGPSSAGPRARKIGHSGVHSLAPPAGAAYGRISPTTQPFPGGAGLGPLHAPAWDSSPCGTLGRRMHHCHPPAVVPLLGPARVFDTMRG